MTMHHRFCFAALVALASASLVLAQSCGGEVDSRGFPCDGDSSCTNGLLCNRATYTCTEALIEGSGPCLDSHACQDGLLCVRRGDSSWCAGSALAPAKAPCGKDDECAGNLQCYDNACLYPEGAPCSEDAECRPGRTCVPDAGGLHVCALPNDLRGACDASPVTQDCQPGFTCQDGRCLGLDGQECSQDEDCAGGRACRPGTPASTSPTSCQAPGGPGDACGKNSDCAADVGICTSFRWCTATEIGTPCLADQDCSASAGLTCRANAAGAAVCQPLGEPGQACDTSSDCAKGGCSPTWGWCAGIDTACSVNADCLAEAGYVCRPVSDQVQSYCALPGDEGETCASNDDCAGGDCGQGVCRTVLGGDCAQEDSLCPAGTVCRATDVGASTTCQYPAVNHEFCAGSGDCADPLRCSQGRCLFPEGAGPCDQDLDCLFGLGCLVDTCTKPGGIGHSCGAPDDGVFASQCIEPTLCGGNYVCIMPHSSDKGEACFDTVECLPLLLCNAGGVCSN